MLLCTGVTTLRRGLKSCNIHKNDALMLFHQANMKWGEPRLTWLSHKTRHVRACVRECMLGEDAPGASGRSIRDSDPQSPAAAGAAPAFLPGPWRLHREAAFSFSSQGCRPGPPKLLLPSQQRTLMERAGAGTLATSLYPPPP